jgi:hypothetical protein
VADRVHRRVDAGAAGDEHDLGADSPSSSRRKSACRRRAARRRGGPRRATRPERTRASANVLTTSTVNPSSRTSSARAPLNVGSSSTTRARSAGAAVGGTRECAGRPAPRWGRRAATSSPSAVEVVGSTVRSAGCDERADAEDPSSLPRSSRAGRFYIADVEIAYGRRRGAPDFTSPFTSPLMAWGMLRTNRCLRGTFK